MLRLIRSTMESGDGSRRRVSAATVAITVTLTAFGVLAAPNKVRTLPGLDSSNFFPFEQITTPRVYSPDLSNPRSDYLLVVTPTSVAFTGTIGQASPAPKSVNFTDAGGGKPDFYHRDL